MEVYQEGPAINPGYEWRLRIETSEPLFAVGDRLVAHIRKMRGDEEVLAELTTEDATIVRLSDSEIELLLPAESSRSWRYRTVVMDVARAFPEPKQPLGFRIHIPIDLTVTRGLP